MDVFLIPTATSDRYELYYEPPDDEAVEDADEDSLLHRVTFGLSSRMSRRFSEMLREAEEWRHRRQEGRAEDSGVMAKLRRKVMGFIVERVAEQRLLWHLRRAEKVCAHIPCDLSGDDADGLIRTGLKRDADHHRKWLLIDLVLLIPAAALTVVPGPNVLGLYFTFQVVSHYLSWKGAKTGLAICAWSFESSAELADLRAAMQLAPAQRQRRFHEVAARLRLERLPLFLEQVAARPA